MQLPPLTLRLSNTLLESTLRLVLPQNGIQLYAPESPETNPAQFQTSLLLTNQLLATDRAESAVLVLDNNDGDLSVPNGIAGILCQSCDIAELFHCLKVVLGGGRYVAPNLIGFVLSKNFLRSPTQPITHPEADVLTAREREVFKLIQQGRTIPEIAEKLCISPHTAEGHRARIQRKLNLKGPHSLIRFASATG